MVDNSRVVELVLRAKNLFSREQKVVSDDLRELQGDYNRLNREIEKDEARLGLIRDYEKLQPVLAEARQNLERTRVELSKQKEAFREVGTATDEQRLALERATINAREASKDFNRLTKEVRTIEGAFDRAGISTQEYRREIEATERALDRNRANLATLANRLRDTNRATQAAERRQGLFRRSITQTYVAVGVFRSGILGVVAALAGFGFAVVRLAGQASALELGLTDVQKVTSLTRAEVVGLGEDLSFLATNVTPSSTTELLKFASAAGRLGIDGRENLLEFTRVMDQLAVSTNLAGEEGADSFGKLLNALGATRDEFENVASALVAVGNNTATTEAQIARFAARIANATKEAGISADISIALAGSLAELGVNAESGGTQIGLLTRELRKFASGGGEDLQRVADITGLTTERIEELGRLDPGTLLQEFLRGLGEISTGGGEATQALRELGITGERSLQIIPPLALNYETLAQNVSIANTALRDGNALSAEAIQFYSAQASEVTRFTNVLRGATTEIGRAFSDEYLNSLQRSGDLIQSNTGFFRELGQILGGVIEGLSDGTEAAVEFLNAVRLIEAGNKVMDAFQLSLDAVVLGLNRAAAAHLEWRLVYNRFTGDQETAAKLQEDLNRINADASRIYERQTDTIRVLRGVATRSFIDLQRAVQNNASAVLELDLADQALIRNILAGDPAREGLADQHIRLTEAIGQQARITGVLIAQNNESLPTYAQQVAALIEVGEQNELIAKLTERAIARDLDRIKGVKDLTAAFEAATERLDGLSTSSETYREQLADETLSVAERQEASLRLADALLLESEAAQQAVDVARRSKAEAEAVTEVIQTQAQATAELVVEQGRLKMELSGLQVQQAAYVDSVLNANLSTESAREALKSWTEGLAENKRQLDAGEISINRYNVINAEFNRGINAVSDALGIETSETQKLTEANKELKNSLDAIAAPQSAFVDALLNQNLTTAGAERAIRTLNRQLEENQARLERGAISINEYNAIKGELERGTRALSSAFDIETEASERTTTATVRATEAQSALAAGNLELAESYRVLGQEVEATNRILTDAAAQRIVELEERNAAVRRAFESGRGDQPEVRVGLERLDTARENSNVVDNVPLFTRGRRERLLGEQTGPSAEDFALDDSLFKRDGERPVAEKKEVGAQPIPTRKIVIDIVRGDDVAQVEVDSANEESDETIIALAEKLRDSVR